MNESELNDVVEKAHQDKKYRPVAVAIIKDSEDRILLVQSAKSLNDWSFPQGGIDKGEKVLDALAREINEETGISKLQLNEPEFVDMMQLDAEKSRKDKRGFAHGKLYLFFTTFYAGPEKIILQTEELAGYKWVLMQDFDKATKTTRESKRNMMQKMLAKI